MWGLVSEYVMSIVPSIWRVTNFTVASAAASHLRKRRITSILRTQNLFHTLARDSPKGSFSLITPPPNTGIVRSGHPYAVPCTTDSTSLTQCSFKLVAPEIRRERSQGRTLIGNLPKFPVPMSRPTRLRFPNKRTFGEAG